MDDRIQTLLTKYFQNIALATGKENDNVRAKVAWSLAQEFLNRFPGLPVSFPDMRSSFRRFFAEQFPFADSIELKEVDANLIEVKILRCCFRDANWILNNEYGLTICPVSPIFVFAFSRGFNTSSNLISAQETDTGCIMQFSIGLDRCSCDCAF
ncbi:MAG: hypothetical protein ACOX37_07585 [Bacillota bacterium]|jgi:hypothetical protein